MFQKVYYSPGTRPVESSEEGCGVSSEPLMPDPETSELSAGYCDAHMMMAGSRASVSDLVSGPESVQDTGDVGI